MIFSRSQWLVFGVIYIGISCVYFPKHSFSSLIYSLLALLFVVVPVAFPFFRRDIAKAYFGRHWLWRSIWPYALMLMITVPAFTLEFGKLSGGLMLGSLYAIPTGFLVYLIQLWIIRFKRRH